MNLKDRTNLLKDSCARIPYGVKCQCLGRVGTIRSIDTFGNTEVDGFSGSIVIDVSHVKPYLFPMSEMTEEQYNQYVKYSAIESIDWLNKNHFDYRRLIPMGIANDATNLNIY